MNVWHLGHVCRNLFQINLPLFFFCLLSVCHSFSSFCFFLCLCASLCLSLILFSVLLLRPQWASPCSFWTADQTLWNSSNKFTHRRGMPSDLRRARLVQKKDSHMVHRVLVPASFALQEETNIREVLAPRGVAVYHSANPPVECSWNRTKRCWAMPMHHAGVTPLLTVSTFYKSARYVITQDPFTLHSK